MTEPKLGVDYVLGCFLSADGTEQHIVRLTPSLTPRLDPGATGPGALQNVVALTRAKKFFLVPVPECADPTVEMKKQIELHQAYLASFPLCASCGTRRSKNPANMCPQCCELGHPV